MNQKGNHTPPFVAEEIREIRGKTLGYISAAMGLVAGLAWNEAITGLIDYLFPLTRNTVTVKFLYAIIITAVVVIVVRYLDKIFNKQDPR